MWALSILSTVTAQFMRDIGDRDALLSSASQWGDTTRIPLKLSMACPSIWQRRAKYDISFILCFMLCFWASCDSSAWERLLPCYWFYFGEGADSNLRFIYFICQGQTGKQKLGDVAEHWRAKSSERSPGLNYVILINIRKSLSRWAQEGGLIVCESKWHHNISY